LALEVARYNNCTISGQMDMPLIEIEQGQHAEQYSGKGTFWTSVFTLANAAIGAGVLAFPYAFAQCGLVLGIFLCFALSIVMGYTAYIVTLSTAHAHDISPESNVCSYQDIARVLVGPRLESAVLATISVFLFGACIGFFIIVGDMAEPVASPLLKGTLLDGHSRSVVIVAVAIAELPLCMLPRVSELGFVSFIALMSVLYIVAVVVADSFQWHNDDANDRTQVMDMVRGGVGGMFTSIPLMCWALHCHAFVPIIYSEIEREKRSVNMMNRVIATSMLVCLCLYLPTGAFGYWQFGNVVPQDVLTGYSASNHAIQIARVGITVTATFSYPICHFAVLTSVFGLWQKAWGTKQPGSNETMVPRLFQRCEATLFVGITLTIALFVSQLAVAFNLFSATCGSLVIFIYPAMFLSKLPTSGRLGALKRNVTIACLVLVGMVILIAGTAATLYPLLFPTAGM